MDYLEENINPEVLNAILLYLNSPKAQKEHIRNITRVEIGVRSERKKTNSNKIPMEDIQLGLKYLSNLQLISTRELKNGGLHYGINQLGKRLIAESSVEDFLEERRIKKKQAIESDKKNQELVVTQIEALKLNIQDLEKSLSTESQATEKRLREKQEEFFTTSLESLKLSIQAQIEEATKKNSPEHQTKEKRKDREQSDFFVSSTKKNNWSIRLSAIAILISFISVIIHILIHKNII